VAAIAFIESNTTGSGHLLLQKALRRGLQVFFLSQEPARYPFLLTEMTHPVVLDTQDADAVLACLQSIDELAAVLSSSDYYLPVAARMASKLGLFGADANAVTTCRDKALLAARLAAAGVAHPCSRVATRPEQALELPTDWTLPLIVKPLAGSGSVGVKLCRDWSDYRAHVEHLFERNSNERGLTTRSGLLVQEFIDGEEFSVEILGTASGYQILGVTRKYLSAPPFFVETGHDFPATSPDCEKLVSTALQALDAVGLQRGPAHVELRLRDAKAIVIEANPRLAGGMIPALIEAASGVDVLERVLDLYLGQPVEVAPLRNDCASIRFIIPERAGTLAKIHERSALRTLPGVVDYRFTKQSGAVLTRHNDFRDRIGWIITRGATPRQGADAADAALAAVAVEHADTPVRTLTGATGRLKQTLHPEALTIVRALPSAQARLAELRLLAAVDEAHLLMLVRRELLPAATVRSILTGLQRLQADDFSDLLEQVAPRGTYLLYEDRLRQEIGDELGGSTHLGRSRNDINATIFRLSLRQSFETVYRALWRLRSTLLAKAARTQDLVMPIYSQHQPGLPGTLGFYFLAVAEALERDQAGLQAPVDDLNTLPLGAGGGGGVGFAIDRDLTARLLGFTRVSRNALDAVASRDLAPRLLASLAVAGVTLSRLTRDLQTWTTQEFAFLALPDDLAGGSSMMPQKKNPYLLEIVQGKALAPFGTLTSALAIMAKTPFSNSVEVGTEALTGLQTAFQEIVDACTLLSLMIDATAPDPARMQQCAEDGLTMATCIADLLVKEHGRSFREAHHRVGAAITAALDQGLNPQAALYQLLPGIDPVNTPLLHWVDHFAFGGGPNRTGTAQALADASRRLNQDGEWLRQRVDGWQRADSERRRQIHALLTESV